MRQISGRRAGCSRSEQASGDGPLEQFFIVGIDDNWKAKEAVSASQETAYGTMQIVAKIPPKMAANFGLGMTKSGGFFLSEMSEARF